MATYVGLLRGINVGGRSKVAMADLRSLLESLGFRDVSTYVQSGNAIFSTSRKSTANIEKQIEQAIGDQLGLEVKVLVRTHDELTGVIKNNPYPDATSTPAQLHVTFLSQQPKASVLSSLDADRYLPDRLHIGDRVLYLHLPNGMGRSKLPPYLSEKRLGVATTTRNWNTVTKLAELAAAVGA